MKEFLNKNLAVLVIAGLLIFFWTQGVFEKNSATPPLIVYTSDTSDKVHTGVVITQPGTIQYIPYPVEKITREQLLDTQFVKEIIHDYYATRIQKDSIKLDSLGSVSATTYTTKNKVDSVKWDYNIKERVVTNTTTIYEPYKPKTQVYYGLELNTPIQQVLGIQQVKAGLMLKNKKDNILKVAVGMDFKNVQPVAEVGYYKKF